MEDGLVGLGVSGAPEGRCLVEDGRRRSRREVSDVDVFQQTKIKNSAIAIVNCNAGCGPLLMWPFHVKEISSHRTRVQVPYLTSTVP